MVFSIFFLKKNSKNFPHLCPEGGGSDPSVEFSTLFFWRVPSLTGCLYISLIALCSITRRVVRVGLELKLYSRDGTFKLGVNELVTVYFNLQNLFHSEMSTLRTWYRTLLLMPLMLLTGHFKFYCIMSLNVVVIRWKYFCFEKRFRPWQASTKGDSGRHGNQNCTHGKHVEIIG